MGKDLKGKDLGKCISQKKDGKYRARFLSRTGSKIDKTFDTAREAQAWLEKARFEDCNLMPAISGKTTVNEVFKVWISHKEATRRENTVRNYINRYEFNIKPVIGSMPIADVKPLHCQMVLDRMKDDYSTSTIYQTFIALYNLMWFAFQNDYIRKSPVTDNVIVPEGEEKKEIDFFSIEEQKRFMQVIKDYAYYEQFALMLLTGLRVSEMVGLTWDCVDLENKTLTVDKILEYRYERRIEAEKQLAKTGVAKKRKTALSADAEEVIADGWRWGKPKTKHSTRTIKLSAQAVEILERLKDQPYLRDTTPNEFRNLVFLSKKNGLPVRSNTYDNAIRKRIDIMTEEINEERRFGTN